jgi:multiple sugar transport system permease protein
MFIWNFNFFDIIWATTRGGPLNLTETFPLLAYRMAFWELDIGYVSALGVIWILILGVFIYLYLRNMKALRETQI